MSTLTFPQLATGALAQLPMRKHLVQRTIVNRSAGESLTKMSDPEGATVAWELKYTGLTDAEMSALEGLFNACEGRLRSFAFADPAGNLLRWTEDLTKNVWQTGLQVVSTVTDPLGGTNATRLTNGGQAPQDIAQTVNAPENYAYTFSVWARSESADEMQISVGEVSGVRKISAEWSCVSVTSQSARGQVTCALRIPGGAAVEVYGWQLDAQAGASGYRRNDDELGVCTARFDQDEIERVSHGRDNHATSVRVLKVQE